MLNMPGPENFTMSMNPGLDRPPSLRNQYKMLGPDYKPQFNPNQFTGLQPVFYGPSMFTDAERVQQGYNGYQPYFAGESSATMLK